MILATASCILAMALWLVRPLEFRGTLSDEGLEVEHPAVRIPYDEMECITIDGRAQDPDSPRLRAGRLMIVHRGGGVLEIPARLNVSVKDLYRAILVRVPLSGSYEISPDLADYRRKEEALFGTERVHAFTRRPLAGRTPSTRRGQICAALLLLCGICWCVFSAFSTAQIRRGEFDPKLGWGIVLSVVGGVSWFVLFLKHRSVVRIAGKFGNAEMVISPTGIALVQDDLKGQLRWDELREMRFSRNGPRFAVAKDEIAEGIDLVIPGTRIFIPDVFDRPFPLIYKLIRRYWKGE